MGNMLSKSLALNQRDSNDIHKLFKKKTVDNKPKNNEEI
jgi:hypothetical protein